MTQIIAELLTDQQATRLAVSSIDSAAVHAAHRAEFALEVCSSSTCHCQVITLVPTSTTSPDSPDSKPPVQLLLDPFELTVVAAPNTRSTGSEPGQPSGQPSGQAIADAITAEDWQLLRDVFFAAKTKAFAMMDCGSELAEFPFEQVERNGELVPLREVIPYAPRFQLPATADRRFTVHEQYCVMPSCNCTVSIVGLSSYCSAAVGPSPIQAEPMVDFQIDWTTDHWRIAGEIRLLTPAEETLRDQLVAANPELLTELRHRHEVMRKLYDVSAAAFGRTASGSMPFRAATRIGRNDPCPCGSGKKYKRCCLLGGNPAIK